ncbi:MAG: Hsp70 family protein, partial [Clostridia bacterium]|nr:Hsp70 family protein [Clostridia bacterium]
QLDGMIFTVEKTIKDNQDKISEEDKQTLENSVAKAKEELASNDFDRITQATKVLSDEVQPIFAKLYQSGNGSNGGEGGGAGDTEFHQG